MQDEKSKSEIPVSYPTATVVQAQPQYNSDRNNSTTEASGAPTGKWRDGILDCCTNLYPSCFCAIMFDGFWIMSQMAHKSKLAKFQHVIIPVMVIWLLCFFVSFAWGWVYAIPLIVAWIFALALRFHLIRHFHLSQTNGCVEFLIGFFCFPCSIAQMARHMYGYRKVFDSDADPDRPDSYGPLSARADSAAPGTAVLPV